MYTAYWNDGPAGRSVGHHCLCFFCFCFCVHFYKSLKHELTLFVWRITIFSLNSMDSILFIRCKHFESLLLEWSQIHILCVCVNVRVPCNNMFSWPKIIRYCVQCTYPHSHIYKPSGNAMVKCSIKTLKEALSLVLCRICRCNGISPDKQYQMMVTSMIYTTQKSERPTNQASDWIKERMNEKIKRKKKIMTINNSVIECW